MQEREQGKEISVWGFDQNGQFIHIFGKNISMMNPNPNRERKEEEEREEEEEERNGKGKRRGQSPMAQQGHGRSLM